MESKEFPFLISWPTILDPKGALTACDFSASLPFLPVRVSWIHSIMSGAQRGQHAHHHVDEIAVAVQGAFTVILSSRDREQREFRLDRPDRGLFIPHGWWRDLQDYEIGTVCLVLSSGPYEEAEYIREPTEFFR